MPRTRSRPLTEEKFKNAVLKLVANEGCSGLGINAVAQLAGADKVLIYRYFGDFNKLLQQVATGRQWLPSSEDVIGSIYGTSTRPLDLLKKIAETISQYVRADLSTHQLVRWHRTKTCPLCIRFTEEWHQLWHELPTLLTRKSKSEQRQNWHYACELLALIVEAELCDQTINRHCLERIAMDLEPVVIPAEESDELIDEGLPTNLL